LRYLKIEERAILVGLLKVQLVKAANSREQHTIVKLLHVAAGLEHHGWVRRLLLHRWQQRLGWYDNSLGQLIEPDDRPGLLAANLDMPDLQMS
jgi:hypothetical protein